MVLVACAIALACLVSVIQSAPLTCEELLRPLAQPDLRRLEGRWALVAGGLSHLPFLERFRQRDSASVTFYRNTTDSTTSYTPSVRLNNECLYSTYNITLEGDSFTYDGTDKSNLTAGFVHTSCGDCLLMLMNMESGRRQHFYLFSRRRQLEQEEMEEYKAQVGCLNMPPPAVMDPTKELCPEENATARRASSSSAAA
uniref:Apolipoprotein M n=1 Tax=Kryptolebias marmoratus TaxID=37003 RepID=A0A3Q3BKG7_KRYMA